MYVCVCARGGEGEIQGSRCANNLAVPHSHGDPHACSQTHCLCTKLLAHSLTQLLCVCPSIHLSGQVSAPQSSPAPCRDALHSDHFWQFRRQLQENIHALFSFTRHMTWTVPMV